MSSIPSKSEGRRRAVSALALKLWEMGEALEQHLERPEEVLDLLVTVLGKGEDTAEFWEKLHAVAKSSGKVQPLANAYSALAGDKRVKLMQPDHQAQIHLATARYFADVLNDRNAAALAAERALAAVPGHPEAFTLLEELLAGPEGAARLARHYYDASARAEPAEARMPLLRRASQLLAEAPGSDDLAVEVELQLFALDPSDSRVRDDLMQRLIGRGRHPQVVDILEASLKRDPAPSAAEAQLLREQAMDICLAVLRDPQRALTHVEGILILDPTHVHARKLAEELVEHRQLGLRAAAALSNAYERTGEIERAVQMLGFELKQVRGPRRVEVQRKLGILRQDVLGDPAGALELLGPVVAGDPGDDDLRSRFVALSFELDQSAQAARLLSRALQTSRDPAVRARVAADVGDVYLRTGDRRRAQAAFQQATELLADDRASLLAATRLVEIYDETNEPAGLAAALELVTKLEPRPEERQVAALRLTKLVEGQPAEVARAAIAWRALVGSPWNDEALDRLEAIYREAGDEEGMADVLGLRAEASQDPNEARALAFRAAELRSQRPRDRAAAIAAWLSLAERYGSSPEIDGRLLPLLEAEGRFEDMAAVLERRAADASEAERIPLLVSIGQLRLIHLGDAAGALQTFTEVLRQKPTEPAARAALERLLGSGEFRLAAADVLEPIYRAEKTPAGLIRVLEARAELGAGPEVFDALGEALRLAENELQSPEEALEIAGWGLERAVALGGDIPGWLGHVERIGATGSSQWRAVFLADALGAHAVDTPELFELACAAGAALASAGDLPRAIETYRRALVFAPSSRDLLRRVDELLAQKGAPEQRLGLYNSALTDERDPTRRRELLHAMATLQGRELADVQAAIATWRAAIEEDPKDLVAHDALVAALSESGDWNGVYTELTRALPFAEGERKASSLLRLGEAASARGDAQSALSHYRELLVLGEPPAEVLEAIENVARACGDGETARTVLELRLTHTAEPAARGALLERLGDVLAGMLDDRATAARIWLEGARLSETQGGDRERARQLYERVLDADPTSREAAERLTELLAEAGAWERLEEVFAVLVNLAGERDVIMLLMGLEERALESRRFDAFVRLLDAGIARVGAGRARHLLLAKARALGASEGREDEAVALYRALLERAGDDAVSDAEAFGAFLRAAPLTPARAADIRWLFEWRLARTASPTDVLGEWALTEETRLGHKQAAADLYGRLVEIDPERIDAWSEIARLEIGLGRMEKASAALEALKTRTEGETKNAAAVKLAAILISPLGRPLEALEAVAPVLEANPGDLEALRIVHRTFDHPECRARAAALLERIALVSDDRVSRSEVIEALLAVSAEAPELARVRTRWLTQFLRTKQDHPAESQRLALQGAEAAPEETELWDIAHETARKLSDPGPVAEAYERAIERELPPAVADELGRRMVEFLEEWFDDQDRVMRVLERVLALAPAAEWAFERLKLSFNSAGRWPELFALYDRRLEAGMESAAETALLREAAMAAKDFASDASRAMGYLERLNRLAPGDGRVESTLERLYERHGRTRPLIDLLTARLKAASAGERAELSARIAALWLDLGETAPAFRLASGLLEARSNEVAAVALLERTLSLPNAREQKLEAGGPSVLESAARLLEQRYRAHKSTVDVVRMLEIEVDVSADPKERAKLLSEVARLRLEVLEDATGAFETLIELVAIDARPEHRTRLADLAAQLNAQERRAETLVRVAQATADPADRAELLLEAATVYDRELTAHARAADLAREVVQLREHRPRAALEAGRRLAEMLREQHADAELVGLLEILAALEPELDARRAALGEAAERALTILNDPARAIRDYRARLALDEEDLPALDGLCRALEAAGRWDELVLALENRAELAEDPKQGRADRVRIAAIHTEVKGDLAAAIEAWRRVRTVHGPDLESFEGLAQLFAAGSLWDDLSRLLVDEIKREEDADRRAPLQRRLGELHEQRTERPLEALDAYAAASDWTSATRVAGVRRPEPALDIGIVERHLELALAAWKAGTSQEGDAPVRWAIAELCSRLLEAGRDAEAVERLLKASQLPFSLSYRRGLRHEAACLASDRLNEGERAIKLFHELLSEDPGDEVASHSVPRLAALLEERARHGDLADLWEAQGDAHVARNDAAGAAELWTRAATLAEEKLDDPKRALRGFKHGAELGGEAALEALARIHGAAGDPASSAEALERLCAISSPELLAGRAQRLVDAYLLLGQRQRARESLEQALPRAADTAPLRKRLAELYREAKDYTALAALLEEEARLASNPAERLRYLREAAALHVGERRDPVAAIPLFEQAVVLEPDEAGLRVSLALALHASERYADAAAVLREQIQRYGQRRPKDRAGVHYELARVLLAAGNEPDALTELDQATRIDPTHAGITQLLASVAFRQGELDRAERMYRALLLTAGKDASGPGRTEALVALGEIAARRGDQARAGEFLESAFESAFESEREADLLETALRSAGRKAELGRLLATRLERGLNLEQAARVLGELVALSIENGDLAGASAMHERARALLAELERTESMDDGAWASLGRAFELLADDAAAAQVLEARVELGGRSSRPPADAELYYRLAAARLGSEETREQGLSLLERAMELRFDPELAQRLLQMDLGKAENEHKTTVLRERVARATGDALGVVRALGERAGLPDVTLNEVHEGIQLAKDLGEMALLEKLVEAALTNPVLVLPPEHSGALRLELAEAREARGDVQGALELREQAAAELPAGEGRTLLLDVAARAEASQEPERAAIVYARILREDPAELRALQPLLSLYARLGKQKEWLKLVEHAIGVVETVEQRSALRLEQARMLTSLGKTKADVRAIDVLRDLLLDEPTQAEAFQLLAGLLEKTERFDELAQLLSADVDAAWERGETEEAVRRGTRLVAVLERAGRIPEAIEAGRRAFEAMPANRELAETLLRLAEATGETERIADALERVLETESGAAAASLALRLAALREEQGDQIAAEQALELAFLASPGDLELLENLLTRLETRGEQARATHLIERALLARPDDRGLLLRLSSAYFTAGDHEQAAAALSRLLAETPDDVSLLRSRATVLVELGREADALADLERAYALEPALASELVQALENATVRAEPPEDSALALRLVNVLESSGQLEAARARLAEFLGHKPDDLAGFRRLASLDQRLGNATEALLTLERLAALESGNGLIDVAVGLYDAAEKAGDVAVARPALERALELDPGHPDVRTRLEALYAATGAHRELGELLLQQAAMAEPAERLLLVQRAAEAMLEPGGDVQTAARILEVAREEHPASIEAATLLARAYAAAGEPTRGIDVLSSVAQANRGRRSRALSAVYEQIAALQLAEGQTGEAVASLGKAFESDSKNARLALELGRLALEVDDAEVAQRAYRAVTIMRPPGGSEGGGAEPDEKAEANYQLALIARKQGDARKARVLVAKALAESAKHEAARALLGELDQR
jgi:tetratricopeptide (TPR) repeat protein